jgi:PHS family inorganic phosphate transporter-like MFS transporter
LCLAATDVAFYGLGLNSSTVLKAAGYGGVSPAGSTAQFKTWKTLHDTCVGNMILAAGGLIPGFWASIALIDTRIGRKGIQLLGFFMLTAIFCVMGFGRNAILGAENGAKGFLVLYCFAVSRSLHRILLPSLSSTN